jgi:hypothetical protein
MRLKNLIKEYQKKIQPTLTPDLSKWWNYPPDRIMSFLYWQKNQIPPTKPEIRQRAWESIKAQLQKLYPEPSGQAGSSTEHPLDKLAGKAMSDPEPDFSSGKEPDA